MKSRKSDQASQVNVGGDAVLDSEYQNTKNNTGIYNTADSEYDKLFRPKPKKKMHFTKDGNTLMNSNTIMNSNTKDLGEINLRDEAEEYHNTFTLGHSTHKNFQPASGAADGSSVPHEESVITQPKLNSTEIIDTAPQHKSPLQLTLVSDQVTQTEQDRSASATNKFLSSRRYPKPQVHRKVIRQTFRTDINSSVF